MNTPERRNPAGRPGFETNEQTNERGLHGEYTATITRLHRICRRDQLSTFHLDCLRRLPASTRAPCRRLGGAA